MYDNRKYETVHLADKMFNTLHQYPEIDQFLDKFHEYFKTKYTLDYLSIHAIHHNKSCCISIYDHTKWHEINYQVYGGINYKGGVVDSFSKIVKKNELYLQYFDTAIVDVREIDVRAEAVGVRKYGGCTVIISDELNNMTFYDLTFKDDSAFGTLDRKVLYDLTKDLIRYKSLLLPFINHADQFNDFSDKAILHKSMEQFISKNPSLFYF